MAEVNNTIGWGQGASNNDIGWGQAAANSASISWGYIHDKSYGHPETNLYGNFEQTAWEDWTLAWETITTTWDN